MPWDHRHCRSPEAARSARCHRAPIPGGQSPPAALPSGPARRRSPHSRVPRAPGGGHDGRVRDSAAKRRRHASGAHLRGSGVFDAAKLEDGGGHAPYQGPLTHRPDRGHFRSVRAAQSAWAAISTGNPSPSGRRMRILHLAKYYWPRSGGMERVVRDLAEGANALGHRAEVVAVRSFGEGSRRPGNFVTRTFSFGALGSQEIAPGYIAAAWRRADVIHVHHPHSLADVACLLRAGRTPVVVTQHADAQRAIYRPVARLVLRRAKAIVVPSQAHVALSSDVRGSESKVEVIPFGIDEGRWSLVPPTARGAPPRALFIGRLMAFKGVDILLRALERVPGLHLDIVGSGPEGPRLRTLSQALALTERV